MAGCSGVLVHTPHLIIKHRLGVVANLTKYPNILFGICYISIITEIPNISIDLGDPASISARLPDIAQLVREKRELAHRAQKDYETWEQLLKRLRALSGRFIIFEELANADEVAPEAIDAVVAVVNAIGKTARPSIVATALDDEGHQVESLDPIFQALVAAAERGLLERVAPRSFAPLGYGEERLEMVAVPEAHMGLGGPVPSSKAEAALRMLGNDPNRVWSVRELAEAMLQIGWGTDSEGEVASLAATLSRLHSERKIHRPARGRYQLGVPDRGEGAMG